MNEHSSYTLNTGLHEVRRSWLVCFIICFFNTRALKQRKWRNNIANIQEVWPQSEVAGYKWLYFENLFFLLPKLQLAAIYTHKRRLLQNRPFISVLNRRLACWHWPHFQIGRTLKFKLNVCCTCDDHVIKFQEAVANAVLKDHPRWELRNAC